MFNVEELTLIKMYGGMVPNRDCIVAALEDVLPFIEDPSIQETVLSTIRKTNAMTNAAFEKLDLSDALDTATIHER
jgi:hypothetical protein